MFAADQEKNREKQVEDICALACSDKSREIQFTSPVRQALKISIIANHLAPTQLTNTLQAVRQSLDKLEETLHELQAAVDGVSEDYKMKQTVHYPTPPPADPC